MWPVIVSSGAIVAGWLVLGGACYRLNARLSALAERVAYLEAKTNGKPHA